MARTKDPRFVCEFEMRPSRSDRRVLRTRLDCADMIYESVRRAMLRRLDRARRDPAWDEARRMPKGEPKSPERKARNKAFDALRGHYGLSEFHAHKHSSLGAGSWLRGHLDSNTAQRAASHA